MKDFSRMNRERCEAPNGFNHTLNSWSLADWLTATIGELGEAANIVKKLNRVRDGIPGNKQSPDELRKALADELGDVLCYLDLTAQSQGILLNLEPDGALYIDDKRWTASHYVAAINDQLGRASLYALSAEMASPPGNIRILFHGALTYLYRLAAVFGIDLEAATLAKFNAKSAEIGYKPSSPLNALDTLRERIMKAIATADERNGWPPYEQRVAQGGRHIVSCLEDEADAAIAAFTPEDALAIFGDQLQKRENVK